MVKRDEVALSSGDSIKYREHGSFLEEEQKILFDHENNQKMELWSFL